MSVHADRMAAPLILKVLETSTYICLLLHTQAHLHRHGPNLLRASGALQTHGFVFTSALAHVPLLLLSVLDLHQSRDERVLHLLLELQFVTPGQLGHQFLRVLSDRRLHPTQDVEQR